MGLLSLSENWIVNNIEYAKLVRSLRESAKITPTMPLENLTTSVPANSAGIIKYIERQKKRIAENLTQEDWDNMTLPNFVSLIDSGNMGADRKQLLLDLEKPSMHYSGKYPIIGMDAIQRMYQKKHAWNLFQHYREGSFPYRVYFKTWKDVQVMKDELDFLVIRHYELYGVKLPSDNPRLFSNTVAHPKYGGQPEITSFGVVPTTPPEPVFKVSKPEPVEEERVVTVAKTDNTKMILLAIVGVGILIAIIFTLRGKNNG